MPEEVKVSDDIEANEVKVSGVKASYRINESNNALFVGKRRSGKSNLIMNVVDSKAYDQVFLITETKDKHNLDSLILDEVKDDFILEEISEDFFQDLIMIVRENNLKILLIFDDYSDASIKSSRYFKQLVKSGRNMGRGIGIIYSTQKYSDVPKVMRENCEQGYFGYMLEMSIKSLSDEMSSIIMPKKALKMNLENISRDRKHDFLYYSDKENKWEKIKGETMKILVS